MRLLLRCCPSAGGRVNEGTPTEYSMVLSMTPFNSQQGNIHRPRVVQRWRDLLGYQSRHNAPELVIDKTPAVRDGLLS